MIKLNDRETASILYALRTTCWSPVRNSTGHFDDVAPLTPEELDELCIRINCGDSTDFSDDDVIDKVLRDDDSIQIEEGMTIKQVLEMGGACLDNTFTDVPVVLFRLKRNGAWITGSVEFVLDDANPRFVRDCLEDEEE